VLDPLEWNRNNTAPTADKPLLIVFKGLIPSLKNERDVGVTKQGQVFSRPNAEVKKAIATIRDSLDRQLPPTWEPIASPQQISVWIILGAHGVTSLPDADLDNMCQTVVEALAAPRVKDRMADNRRKRLIMQDDKQFVSLHLFAEHLRIKTGSITSCTYGSAQQMATL
jgi:hypothetical protein